MKVRGLELEDYHDLVNALLDGPSLEGIASFHVEWSASRDKHRFHDPGSAFDSNVVFNSAKCAWAGKTEAATFVSDPASTSHSLFAEVGEERNGVFFH